MRVAVVGSRNLSVSNLGCYLPDNVTEIISGGAKGVDTSAREYAIAQGLPLREFLPECSRYGKSASLKRNLQIISQADLVLAFWDGSSHGTRFVIDLCHKMGIPVQIWVPAKHSESLVNVGIPSQFLHFNAVTANRGID